MDRDWLVVSVRKSVRTTCSGPQISAANLSLAFCPQELSEHDQPVQQYRVSC